MPRTVIEEIYIPAGQAKAFTVSKGQIFRIQQVEEKQVADVILINADNRREKFHAGYTVILNCIKGIGNTKAVKELYSQPPYENVMATVIDDPVGIHFPYMGTRCSRTIYKLRDKVDVPPHRTCQDNLAEVIAPYGLGPEEVPDVFNVWMNVDIDKNGCFVFKPPVVGHDGYIDIKAEMNLLVAVSACPSDKVPVNDFRIKPLKAIIYEA